MAHANNIGLNEISELGVPVVSAKRTQGNNTTVWSQYAETMEAKSKIPKFGFGVRRTNGEKKLSPGSSPVSRSKSMKVQRTTIPLIHRKTKHSNSVEHDDDCDEAHTNSFLQTPTNHSKSDFPKSQPSSRSTTPINDHSTGLFTRSMTVSSNRTKDVSSTGTRTNGTNKTHARSSSFSSREKYGITTPTSLRKPTAHSQVPEPKLQTKGIPQPSFEPSRQVRRSLSNSKTSHDESDGNIESSYSKQGSGILRNPDSRRSSVSSQGSSSGGRRPSSMISFTEKSSDLNQLASEITQMGDSHVFGSAPPRIPSSRSHVASNRQGTVILLIDSFVLIIDCVSVGL